MSKRLEANHFSKTLIRTALSFALIFVFSVSASAQWMPTRVNISQPTAPPGGLLNVDVKLERPESGKAISDFDFLITYDPDFMTFYTALPGTLINNCGWEFFDHQVLGPAPGVVAIRVRAKADVPEVPGNPSCYTEGQEGTLATLQFIASTDSAYLCQSSPVEFFWNSCTDNYLSSPDGDTAYISYNVCGPFEEDNCNLSAGGSLPTLAGTPDVCTGGLIDGKVPSRSFSFIGGSVSVDCGQNIDAPGDLNLNGIGYEIADLLLYTDYFFYGLAALDPNPQFRNAQIAASDANQDGSVLTFQDLVYLYRVIIGDALPFPKPGATNGATAYFTHNDGAKFLRADYPGDLAGAWLVFEGTITPTFFVSQNNRVEYAGGRTRIMMLPDQPGSHPSGLWFTYTGTGTLDSVETADWADQDVPVDIVVSSFVGYCGDSNSDGQNNISDLVYLVNYIFAGGPPPLDVAGSDVNCDGTLNISDIVYLVAYIFAHGPAPCANCQ